LLRSRVARAPTPANKALGIGPLSWHPDNKSVFNIGTTLNAVGRLEFNALAFRLRD